MSAAPKLPIAYRHALILSAVVFATVLGIVLVDPDLAPPDEQATTLASSRGSATAPVRGTSTAAHVALGDAAHRAADRSAAGAGPDTAH